MQTDKDDRWEREAAFFDKQAKAKRPSDLLISRATIDRYANSTKPEFPAEYRFIGLGSLKGKLVLDIGCGDGESTVLLALLGATVTGIDISPDAITVAKERALVNGVAEQTTFICKPLEVADIPRESFDVIWCDAFLHHVIPDLKSTLDTMKSWLISGGKIVISEPVSLSPKFRALRLALLPAPDATPDERPLEPIELSMVHAAFPASGFRYFGLVARAAGLVLPNGNYEQASVLRRATFRLSAQLDQTLFSLGLRDLSSQIVFHGTK